MRASYDALPDLELALVAQRYLDNFPPRASLRNEIEELLWADARGPAILKKSRREVARVLAPSDLYMEAKHFDKLLNRLWVLDSRAAASEPDEAYGSSLRREIERHVYRNPGDWSVETLFENLGAFDCSDHRFALFLEGLASSDVRPDEESQRNFVGLVNEPLRKCGAELRESGNDGGYPVFKIVSTAKGANGRPKNLIFASPTKPDIRLIHAITNDIEVVSNADDVLIYDRPIPADGLLWRDLQDWWADREQLDPKSAKDSLYLRLRASLPTSSPPQLLFFRSFFKTFDSAVPSLPALLPEVWLHWDPKTIRERGVSALLGFRMDFMMLISQGVRIVIEVDGQQHYADEEGKADTRRYAAMAAADRDLRLSGYEVYRFGGAELQGEKGPTLVGEFFHRLFHRHGVKIERR